MRRLAEGLRRSVCLPTMTVVGKKPAGGLRNTLYDQQTRSGRRLSRGRLLLYKLAVPVAFGLGRLVWRWTRVVRVVGAEHIGAALARAPSFIPVYWHQHQLFCIKQLSEMRAAGREARLSDFAVGGWGIRSHDGATTRRRGDPRILLAHRRPGAARLLSGARARRHLAGDHPGRTPRAAVEVQTGRDSAGADVSAPHHPPGLCGLARVGHPVGPLRDPEALRPRCHRGRAPRCTSAKGSTPRGWPRCNWIWSETWKIFTGKHAVSLSKIGLTLNNTIAYLVFLISYARIAVYVPLSNLWENCVIHSHFSPVRVANC